MITNTCEVCERPIYTEGFVPTTMASGDASPSAEVDVYITVGSWGRSFNTCENCAKRLILEIESFMRDSWAFREMSLGELQDRLDSIAQSA